MFDIVTFGSAAWDVFLRSNDFKIIGKKKFLTGKGLCLSLGSKVNVEDIYFATGGGGTNTVATFNNQGFKAVYCGMVGEDPAADDIISDLKGRRIDTRFILRNKFKPSNHSIILSFNEKERTILTYRGASGELLAKDIPWDKLQAKWFYLAPLSGKMCSLFEYLVDFAAKNKIKVAVNPGNSQLSLPPNKLRRILSKVDVLILNQEEASLLTKTAYQQEADIFKKIDEFCPGVVIMTKGLAGATVSDGQQLYRAKALTQKRVELTGAGDSFGAGFLSGYIKSQGDIEFAIQLGSANANACIQKIGAKNGLLKKGDKWQKVRVDKESCSENNRCITK